MGTAKRTPRAAMLLSSAGDKILVKTGLCYDPLDGSFLFFSGVSNIEVGTYGTASDKPIFDGLTYQNPGVSGWTYVNSGVWKKTFGGFFVRRLWVGSINLGNLISQRTLGIAKRRAYGPNLTGTSANPAESVIIAGLGPNMIWFGGGPATSYALYVYTGTANIDPPTYYDGIAFLQTDGPGVGRVGSPSGIHVQNQGGIHAHDIHMRGVNWGFRMLAQNSDARDASDCLFENCIVTAPYQSAFKSVIAGEASSTRFIRNIVVRNIYCDYWSSADETEPDANYDNLSGIGDNFCLADGSRGIIVENCTSINAAHQGLVAGSLANRDWAPSGCRFLGNTVLFSDWHAYPRGMSCYDGDTVFQGNLIDGQGTRSQFAGSAKVIGNVWVNLRAGTRKPGTAQWIACESYMQDMLTPNIGNSRYLRVQPINLVITNNTVYAPVDPAIAFNFYDKSSIGEGDNSFNAGAITIQNNTVVGSQNLFLLTYEDSTKTIGQQIINKNCVYNGIVGGTQISWRGGNYGVNAAPGAGGNLEVDPGLLSSHKSTNAALLNAGAPVTGLDFYGKRFPTIPPIGSVVPHPARSVTTRSVTARSSTSRSVSRVGVAG